MNTYVVGIDGGGTKSTGKVIFHSERPPILLTGGPLNICSAGKQQVDKNIGALLSEASEQAGPLQNCTGICLGAAGYTCSEAPSFLKNSISRHSGCAHIIVTSDAYIALCGALNDSIGVALIAGTGSICNGVNARGEFWRTGGAGHLIDDEGSGYAIGRDILSTAVRALDGRAEQTMLTQLLKERRGLETLADIISFAYDKQADKSMIASLAPLLTEACDSGDVAANRIALHAVGSLLLMSATVIDRLALFDASIALCGSILQKERYIFNPFKSQLHSRYPNLTLALPAGEAVDGALFLAKKSDLSGLPVYF